MTLSILDYYEVDENRVVSVILLVVQAGRQADRHCTVSFYFDSNEQNAR